MSSYDSQLITDSDNWGIIFLVTYIKLCLKITQEEYFFI